MDFKIQFPSPADSAFHEPARPGPKNIILELPKMDAARSRYPWEIQSVTKIRISVPVPFPCRFLRIRYSPAESSYFTAGKQRHRSLELIGRANWPPSIRLPRSARP